jgi:hypothetical protein
MSTFWKNLAQVAQGQLFMGGHLSHAVVAEMAKCAQPSQGQRNGACGDHLPWPRLAIPH